MLKLKKTSGSAFRLLRTVDPSDIQMWVETEPSLARTTKSLQLKLSYIFVYFQKYLKCAFFHKGKFPEKMKKKILIPP